MSLPCRRWIPLVALLFLGSVANGQEAAEEPAGDDQSSTERGSLIEDRAARKLLEAGDMRLEADEPATA